VREAVLFTRADCHLCHRAREVLDAIARDTPMTVVERDVDADAELRQRYGEAIPVVQVDGRVLAAGRISEFRLRRALGVPPTPRAWLGIARAAFRSE
jgi:hypothetical protein